MRHTKHLIALFLLTFWVSITNWYYFGLKSFDNSIENIVQIQTQYNVDIPIVSFIFDPRSDNVLWTINNLTKNLWTWKIYHITLSPNSYSAKQVAEWIFDDEYKAFFQAIKDNNLKVIFRTMHEMNWWRYPRSSNPDTFKKARIHVWNLSREVWLDQQNILFDFSVNHRDMPTKWTPSQTAKLITCTPSNKIKKTEEKTFIKTWYRQETITKQVAIPQSFTDRLLNKKVEYTTVTETKTIAYPIYKTEIKEEQQCFSFEDYYPWDKYVDIMWVTFYNRWKATYSRSRYLPNRILNDTNRDTLKRLRAFHKPIFIDEVGTTAVRYNWKFDFWLSQNHYETDFDKKNTRLSSLKTFLIDNSDIFWAVYFNVDYTNWLSIRTPGEADRAIINLNNWKFYTWFYDLYNHQWEYRQIFRLFSWEAISQQPQKNTQNQSTISRKEKNEMANVMIKRFWKEDSLRRAKWALELTDNENLKSLLNDLITIFENIT